MNPFEKQVLDEVTKKIKKIKSEDTLNTLCQNKKQWKGVTVFRLNFNGFPIKFINFQDAKAINKRTTETSRLQALEIIEEIKQAHLNDVQTGLVAPCDCVDLEYCETTVRLDAIIERLGGNGK